ncbi:MAG: hypothetical protein ABFC84_11785 [Veillonellales bacterium]
MEEKIMHLANFNITFGDKEEPMLSHFEDVIFPAFNAGYIRGKKDEIPSFLLNHVKIKKFDAEEYVLVGNYIKETEYRIHTTVKNGELTVSPAQHPTAPYSRFIIFLKNHRMVLVRNENASPDIRSFQKTVRFFLSKYVREFNKEEKKKNKDYVKLPKANVNIVDIPLREDIESILKNVKKIDWVTLRFFPLNNDFDQLPMASAVRAEMKKIGSSSANAKFNSPDSKEGIKEMLVHIGGQAAPTIRVTNENGEKDTIKEDSFSSNKKIPFARDILSEDDVYLIGIAQKESIINVTSSENIAWYKRILPIIRSLL